MNKLTLETAAALRRCSSIHQPWGFQGIGAVLKFWHQHGPTGFLNIKEITPDMVTEIRRTIHRYTNH